MPEEVFPKTAQVFTLNFMQPDMTGKWSGLAVLLYGLEGPIHDAAYIKQLSAWAVYPKGVKYMPHMHQITTTKEGGRYTPLSYANGWWLGASELAVSQMFRSWVQLPAGEYVARLYFQDGRKSVVYDL